MKKFLLIFLTLLLVLSCGVIAIKLNNRKTEPVISYDERNTYLDLLENYEVKDKSVHADTDNKEFNDYLDEVFDYYISQDFLSLHYTIKDFRAFGIEKPEVTIGEVEYGFDEEGYNNELVFLERLHAFDFKSLSLKQQTDYECLEYSIYEDLVNYYFYKYNFLFSSDACMPESLYSNLTDYTFYDRESVEDYLTILKDTGRFFDDCVSYTDAQQKDGVYLLDEHLDYTIDAINGVLVSKEDNDLIVGFDSRIDSLDFLSSDDKEQFKVQNRDIVLSEVLPAYEKLGQDLNKYYGKTKIEKNALCDLDKDYARFRLIISSSCNKNPDDILYDLVSVINYFEDVAIEYLSDDELYNQVIAIETDPDLPFVLDAQDGLEFLRTNCYKYYPELGECEYDAQILNPDTAPSSAIAYYYPSPIDDTNQNVIRINPNNIGGGTASYITLAHEGFPGHLFQHVYQARRGQHRIHDAIGFSGFTEGYAVYASRDAMLFSGVEDLDLADVSFYLNEYYFPAYSLVDLLVNYYGYSTKEVQDYFEQNIYLNYFGDNYEGICNFVIEMPGVYQRYGVGFTELVYYRLTAEYLLGENFDVVDYNDMLTKDGDTPFVILEDKWTNYINEKTPAAQ